MLLCHPAQSPFRTATSCDGPTKRKLPTKPAKRNAKGWSLPLSFAFLFAGFAGNPPLEPLFLPLQSAGFLRQVYFNTSSIVVSPS